MTCLEFRAEASETNEETSDAQLLPDAVLIRMSGMGNEPRKPRLESPEGMAWPQIAAVIEKGRPTLDREWFTDLATKMERLRDLEKGWDGDEAAAPNDVAIYNAKQALQRLEQLHFAPHSAGPSVEEGLSLEWSRDGRYAGFEFLNNGDIVGMYYDRNIKPVAILLAPNSVNQAINEVFQFINA